MQNPTLMICAEYTEKLPHNLVNVTRDGCDSWNGFLKRQTKFTDCFIGSAVRIIPNRVFFIYYMKLQWFRVNLYDIAWVRIKVLLNVYILQNSSNLPVLWTT